MKHEIEPHRLEKVRLGAEQLAALRRFRAKHGGDRAPRLLKTSKHTLAQLLAGGGVTPAAALRVAAELARAS